MTTPTSFPDLPILNLTYLLKIQADANKDPVQACYRYNLPEPVLAKIKELPVEQLASFVANLDQSFFVLRTELLELFNAPPPLAGLLAAVRASGGANPSNSSMPRSPVN